MFRLSCIRLAGVLSFAFATFVMTAPGHGHGDSHEPATAVGPASPRVVAQSESYELVGISKEGQLTIFLDRVADTSPVVDARIELTVGGQTAIATPTADGTYVFVSPVLAKHGDHEVIATIEHAGGSDLLIGTLKDTHDHSHDEGPSPAAGTRDAGPLGGISQKLEHPPVLAGVALAFGVMIGAVVVRGRAGLILGLAGLFAVLGVGVALAGPGHDHDHGGGPAAALGDAPRRLPSGELFLPKPTQRLLAIRTRVLATETARSSDRLIGRVVSDPNRSGLVQSTIGGRIRVTPAGLPRLGEHVKKGQVLAYVEPAFAPIDSSDVRQTAGDLAQRIAVLEARLARQKRLVGAGVANAASLEDIEIERDGLEARRRQLAQSRSEPEALLAPVDGVIAETRVVAGQVVSSADTLFNILDPSSLWVEAISFDPRIDPALAKAQARTSDGEVFDLTFVGRSRALQQQATVLQFRVDAPGDTLNIGAPVKVLIEKGDPIEGLILPRSAIAQAPNGQVVAFKRLQPERYLPVAVRTINLDGDRVIVEAGLAPGDQIIVEGAPLVNQIR